MQIIKESMQIYLNNIIYNLSLAVIFIFKISNNTFALYDIYLKIISNISYLHNFYVWIIRFYQILFLWPDWVFISLLNRNEELELLENISCRKSLLLSVHDNDVTIWSLKYAVEFYFLACNNMHMLISNII